MVLTAQQMIERERLFKEVGGKVQEEQLTESRELRKKREKLKWGQVGRGIERVESARLPKSRPRISYKKSRKVGRAVTGILGALLPSEAMAGAVTYVDKKKGTGKRGRPVGTFKARFLPDGRVVRVPTHIYRRMLSEYKAKKRLAEAKRQAGIQEQYEAEQIAMSQDPRFQQAQTDEQFLEGEDPVHEARLAEMRQRELIQQQLAQQPQPSRFQQVTQRAGQLLRGVGTGFVGQRGFPPQQIPQQFDRQFSQSQQFLRPPKPQLRIISDKSSILNVPNIFNDPSKERMNRW